jgi:hypothetical protein
LRTMHASAKRVWRRELINRLVRYPRIVVRREEERPGPSRVVRIHGMMPVIKRLRSIEVVDAVQYRTSSSSTRSALCWMDPSRSALCWMDPRGQLVEQVDTYWGIVQRDDGWSVGVLGLVVLIK